MTYTLFFIPDYHFQKAFYVSLGNNFFTVFCGGPWATAQFAPPIKSGPGSFTDRVRQRHDLIGCSETLAKRN